MPVWLPCTVPMLLKVENNVVSAVYVLYDIYAMSAEWLSKLAVIFHFPFCSVKIGLGGGATFLKSAFGWLELNLKLIFMCGCQTL